MSASLQQEAHGHAGGPAFPGSHSEREPRGSFLSSSSRHGSSSLPPSSTVSSGGSYSRSRLSSVPPRKAEGEAERLLRAAMAFVAAKAKPRRAGGARESISLLLFQLNNCAFLLDFV